MSDALSVSPASLSFTTSNWNRPQTITVTALADEDADGEGTAVQLKPTGYTGDESEFLTVNAIDLGAGLTLTSPSPSSLTVNNTGTYTVKLKSKPSDDVTVTPISSNERIATVSGDLTFTSANWKQAQTVTVTGKNAGSVQIAHTWESLNDYDYYQTMATSPVVFSVTDTGSRTLTLEALTTTVEEGKSITVTAKLDRAHTADVKGLLRPRSVGSSIGGQSMTAEKADFTPTANPTNITIPKGSTSASVVFTAVNEAEGSAVYEGDETFGVELFGGGTSGVFVDPNNRSAIITITDEADQPIFELVPPDPLHGAEGDQNKDRVFKVTKTGATELPATVDIASTDVTTTAPDDYAPIAKTLNFAQAVTEQSVTVTFKDDTEDELTEDFTVTLSNPTAARLGTTTSATVELTDDDPTVVSLTVSTAPIAENAETRDITVTLGRPLTTGESLPVTLDFAGDAAFGEDYTLSAPKTSPKGVAFKNLASAALAKNPPTVTFTGGDSASDTAILTLTTIQDQADEGDHETVTVSLGALDANSGTGLDGGAQAHSTNHTHSFQITDDDGTPTGITLTVDTDTATEGAQDKVSESIASPPSVEVTATIDGNSVFTEDKTISVSVVGDTAKVTDDFEAVTAFDLTLPAGDSSIQGSFTLTPVYDGVKEDDETISVTGTLTPAVQGLTVKPATITLVDHSVIPEISVSVDNSGKTITEGSQATYTLTSSTAIPVDITVNVTLTQQGSFVPAQTITDTTTVTIPKNTTRATLNIDTQADSTDEADGSLTLTLGAADNGEYTVSTTQGNAVVSVTDNDATVISLVAGASSTLTEGDTSTSATLTLRLGRALVAGEIVEVPLAITTSSGAVIVQPRDAERDYILSATGAGVSQTLFRTANPRIKFTGGAGVRVATLTLTATARDDGDEDHEALNIALGNVRANGLTTRVSGRVVADQADKDVDITIQDDEGLKPKLTVVWAAGETLPNSPTEGGTVKMLIKADPAPQADMTVHFTVSERAGANYVAAGEEGKKTVTLKKGASQVAVNVPTVNDEKDEIGGLVYVTLVADDAYRLGRQDNFSRLVKDDDKTAVSIERDCRRDCYPISENGGTEEFVISLGLALNRSDQTVTVPLNVTGATAGTHYTLALKSGAQTGVSLDTTTNPHSLQNPAVKFSGAGAQKAVLTLTTIDNNDNNNRNLEISLGTPTSNQYVFGGVEQDANASTASVKIVNDDGTPVVRVEAQVAELIEGHDAGGNRDPYPKMYIYAEPVPQTDITVSATLSQEGDVLDSNGARPGKMNYVIQAGQAAPHVIEFRIENDLDDEPTGSVTLQAHAGTGYTLASGKSRVTTRIIDADGGPTVSLSRASASVTEGGNAAFTVTRSTEGAHPAWADEGISVVRLRISQRGDFVSAENLGEKTITLNKGETEKTYEVPTLEDTRGEKDGMVTVELLPSRTTVNFDLEYAVDFPPNNQATVTVVDDDGDGVPGVSIYNEKTTVSEKNLTGTGSYTVELATDPGQTATLTVKVPDAHQDSLTVQGPGGTAGSSATVDFTAGVGGTWDTPQMITIAPRIDDDGDPDTFELTHSITNYTVPDGSIKNVSVTVQDIGYHLKLSHNNTNKKLEVAEPKGQETYDLWLTSQPANDVTVTPSIALSSSDVTLATVGDAVTFTATDWKTPKSIAVSGLKQGATTITHTVTSTDTNYQLSGNFPVGVSVIADNRRPVELSATPDPVVEGADVTLTATIPQAVYPAKAVTIPLTYTEGTAVAADYTAVTGITIDAGQTTGTATLATVDDTDYETPNETFTVAFGTLPRELNAGTTTSALIAIDDAADIARKVNLSVAKTTVQEGRENVRLTATLDSALTAPARPITIPLTYTLGTAQAEDFTEVAGVTIEADDTSATVSIQIVDDADYETPDETFTIALDPTLPDGLEAGDTTEIDIGIDDFYDGPTTVNFTASEVVPVPIPENSTGVPIPLVANKAVSNQLTIPLVYTYGTAKSTDINEVTQIVVPAETLLNNSTDKITLNITDDNIYQGPRTFTVAMGELSFTPPDVVNKGAPAQREFTIIDEDDAPSFEYASSGLFVGVDEGNPELALSRKGETEASSFFSYTARPYQGAKAGDDFKQTSQGEIEVPADDSPALLLLPIIDDDEDEASAEYFAFNFNNMGHQGVNNFPRVARYIRIIDDDPTPVTLSPSSDVEIGEGDVQTTAELTLTLKRTLETVKFLRSDPLVEVAEIPLVITSSTGAALPGAANADFILSVSGNGVTVSDSDSSAPVIKFSKAGESGTVQTATITLTATNRDDGDFQDENIQIALGDLGASTLATNLEGGVSASDDGDQSTDDNQVTITIVDDEEGPDGFDLSVDTNSVAENAQAATITVTATAKDDGSFAQDQDIEITVGGGADDTAISGTDYAAVTKFTITVLANQSSATGSFSLDPTDDGLDEADETLSVTGTSGSLVITPASITITDDDPEPTVSVADATAVTEGDDPAATTDMTFTVSLLAASGKDVSVPYTLTGTATGSSDYDAPATLSLTIAAGSTSGDIVIPVKGDAIDELDETILVTLDAPTNATISTVDGAGSATGTITDDDVPELTITAGAAVTEGTAASFTVEADIAPVDDLTVNVGVVDATAGFVASGTTGAQTFTFRATETSETYEVNTESDTNDEADGSVAVTLKDGTGYTVASSNDSARVVVSDDDETTVTLARAGSGGIAEDGGTDDITVTLGRALVADESVTVPLTVTGATETTHYTLGLKGSVTGVSLDTTSPHNAQNPAVTLSGAGVRTATLTLTAVANTDNASRTVLIAYGTSSRAPTSTGLSGGISTSGTASVPILDDDAQISVTAASAAEGSAVVFTVNLPDPAPSGGVTIDYSTSDGRGNNGDTYQVATSADYTAASASASITIAQGDSSGTISIATTDDTTYEGDHHFTLTLESTDTFNISATAGSAIGTITDVADTPSFEFSAASTDEDEDAGAVTLTIERTGTTLVASTVSYATNDGTAAGGSDFTAIASTDLTFAAGDPSKDITVTITDDSTDETTEAFTVDLTAGADAVLDGTTSHSISITDNDATTVALDAPAIAIDENAGTKTITVTLGRALEGDETLAVPLTFAGTGTFGDDYTLAAPNSTPTGVSYSNLASSSLTGSPPTIAFSGVNSAASSATVILTATNDTIDESATESVTVGLGTLNANSGTNLDGGASGSGTATFNITDDDVTPTVTLALTPATIDESGDDNVTTVTATLSGASSQDVTLTVAAAAVSPAIAGDFTLSGTTLTIAAGATTTTGTVTITAVDNTVDAPNKTVTVSATASGGGVAAPTSQTLTIADDDERGIRVSTKTMTLAEIDDPSTQSITEHQKTYTVELDTKPTGTVTVNLASADTKIATLSDTSLEFTASDWGAQTVTVTAVPDAIDNADDERTVRITHTVSATGTDYQDETAAPVNVTVTDDDGDPTLSIDAPTVTEGDSSTTTLTFKVTLSPASGKAVSVGYADATTGTATSATDYAVITSGALDFAAGDTEKTIDITVNGDEIDEPNETIVLRLSSPSNATLSGGKTTLDGTGTIADDDTRGISVSPLTLTLAEVDDSQTEKAENEATYTVELDSEPTGTVTVSLASGDQTVATLSATSLEFTASDWDAQTVTVTAVPDDIDNADDERTVRISHTVVATGTDYKDESALPVDVTVTDDDDEPTLSIDAPTVTEGDSSTTILTFKVTLSPASGKAVSVAYADAGMGTATSATDYAAITSGTLNFAAGDTEKTVAVTINGDEVDEPNETVILRLSSPSNAALSGGKTTLDGTGTITDDDVPELSVSGPAITEGSDAIFTIVADPVPHSDLSVQFAISESGGFVAAAATGSGKSVTLAGGTSSVDFKVETIGDTVDEASGSVTLTLADGTGYALASDQSASITIRDDDKTQVTLAKGADTTLTEREPTDTGSLTITLSRDLAPGEVAVVPLALTTTTDVVIAETDAALRDFTISASGAGVSLADENTASPKITITGGAATEQVATVTFAATPRDDGDLDPDRLRVAFGLLTNTSLGTVLDGGIEAGAGLNRETIDIIDYRDPAIVLSTASVNLKERFTGETYDVQLASNPRATVTVRLSASEQGKLELSPATLTFTPDGDTIWSSPQKVTITASTDDDVDDETITVTHAVTAPEDTPYHQISNASLQANITDFGHDLDIGQASYGVRENGGENHISIVLTGRPTADVTLTATTEDGEYIEILPGPRVFTAASWKQGKHVAVRIKGLTRPLGESKFVSVDIIANSADLNYNGKTLEVDVEILEDIRPLVTLAATPSAVAEGADLTLTATIDKAQVAAVAVPLVYTNDTAVAGDYTAVANLTIAANQTRAEAKVAIADDSIYEGSEAFSIAIGDLETYRTGEAVDVTIDDEADAPTFSFALTGSSAAEADGTHSITVNKTGAASVPVSLAWSTADGTALAASDYTGVSAGSLDFPAMDASASLEVTLTDDEADELDENFYIDLAAGTGARLGDNTRHTVTLTDSDPTLVSLSATGGNIAENAGAKTLTVALGRALSSGESLAVPLTISGAAALGSDYVLEAPDTLPSGVAYTHLASDDPAANPPTVTFTGGDGASASATLTLKATPDVLDEGASEQVRIRLGTLVANGLDGGAAASDDGNPSTADNDLDFLINDDDDAPTGITLSLDTDSVKAGEQSAVAEDVAAAVTVSVTATVDGSTTFGTATDVELSIGTEDDSASSGDDYKAVNSFTLTIPAGATSVTGEFTFEPEDDVLDEGDESVGVSGESGDLTVTGASLEITDNDGAPDGITLSVDTDEVAEDAGKTSITVTATVGGSTRYADARTVTVTVGDSGDSAVSGVDYANVTAFDLEIPAGETSVSKAFDLTPTDDSLDEVDEIISITGESDSLTVDGTSITLTDDDAPPTVSVANATAVIEGDAPDTTVDMSFTVSLSTASAKAITVPYTLSGTATGGSDYETPASTSLSIAAGENGGTIVVKVKGDTVDEPNETVIVTLGAPTNATVSTVEGAGTATGTINDDDDTPVVTLKLAPATIDESGATNASTVTATLNGTSSEVVTLTVAASAVSPAVASDFALSGTTLTIAAGATESTGTVTITARDNDVDAPNKTVTVSAVANGGGVATPSAATLTITDDDTRGISVSPVTMTLAEVDDTETPSYEHKKTYSIELDSQPTGTVTVNLASGDTDIATLSATSLEFTASDWDAQTVTVTAVDDEIDNAGDERTVRVTHTVSAIRH